MITYDDFKKVEMKVGQIVTAEPVEKSEKLLRLTVDFGEENPRQVISGIAKSYKPEDIIGKQFVFVVNLEPRSIMGLESQAMILAANGDPSADGGPIALTPNSPTPNGATIQ